MAMLNAVPALTGLLGAPPVVKTPPPVSPLLGAKLAGKGALLPQAPTPATPAPVAPAPVASFSPATPTAAPPPVLQALPALQPINGLQPVIGSASPAPAPAPVAHRGADTAPDAIAPAPAPSAVPEANNPVPAWMQNQIALTGNVGADNAATYGDQIKARALGGSPVDQQNVTALTKQAASGNEQAAGLINPTAQTPLPAQPLPTVSSAPAPAPTPETVAASTPPGEVPKMPNPTVPPVASPPVSPVAQDNPVLTALGPPPTVSTPAYVQTPEGAAAAARVNSGTLAAADPNAGLSEFGPGNDLRSTQIAPAASDRLIGMGQQTNRARELSAQSLEGLINTPDRQALASDALQNYIRSTEADYQRRQQDVGRQAAALGRIGSGMTADDVMRLGNSRDQEIVQKAAELANSTAGQQFADQQARLASSLNAGSQFGASEGDQFARESAQRGELRGERGYQGDLAQQAINNRANQAALEASLQNQDFNQNLDRARYASGVADTYDTQGNDAQTAAADSIQQQALLRALGMTGDPAAGGWNGGAGAPAPLATNNPLAGLTQAQIDQILRGGL